MHAGPCEVQKRAPDRLALELQVIVGPLMWILGMELRSLEEQEVSCLYPVSSSLLNEQLSGIKVLMVVRSLPPSISRIVFMFPNCSQTVAIQ